MKIAKSKNISAFTMVEIALAIAIIGIGLLAVIGTIPALLSSSRSAIENTEVALTVQQEMEYDFSPISVLNMTNLVDDTTVIIKTNSPSFRVQSYISYIDSTNGIYGLNGAAFKDLAGNTLLKTERITYLWPPKVSANTKQQIFTFVTERAATQDIPYP